MGSRVKLLTECHAVVGTARNESLQINGSAAAIRIAATFTVGDHRIVRECARSDTTAGHTEDRLSAGFRAGRRDEAGSAGVGC